MSDESGYNHEHDMLVVEELPPPDESSVAILVGLDSELDLLETTPSLADLEALLAPYRAISDASMTAHQGMLALFAHMTGEAELSLGELVETVTLTVEASLHVGELLADVEEDSDVLEATPSLADLQALLAPYEAAREEAAANHAAMMKLLAHMSGEETLSASEFVETALAAQTTSVDSFDFSQQVTDTLDSFRGVTAEIVADDAALSAQLTSGESAVVFDYEAHRASMEEFVAFPEQMAEVLDNFLIQLIGAGIINPDHTSLF